MSVNDTITPKRTRRRHWWYVRGTLKVMATFFVFWFLSIC